MPESAEPESEPVVVQQAEAGCCAVAAPAVPVRGQKDEQVWTSQGLQGLLAGLAQQDSPASPEVLAPQLSSQRPDLQHIRVIAVVSGKGGVGKSTMAANLAVTFAKAGSAVLVLELDPQNALRQHFRAAEPSAWAAAAGLAVSAAQIAEQCLHSSDGVTLLPYGVIDEPRRREFEQSLANDPHWLAQQLADLHLSKGTVVLLDTPPGPSVYLQQALSVANLALVVSLADAASYTALPFIDSLIATYSQEAADFVGSSYLINQVDPSRKLNQDITQIMQGLLGSRLAGMVHADPAIGEALAYNRNVFEYAPNSSACQDIVCCAQTLVERLAANSHGEQTA
ncbi:cellulose biosynthesis protein BcsQ [Pseudomonas sp. 5P_3.1_Bac2]|uniref:cellulose biosynthesis protein BcsQ n=1 Tax=Pseudomonas sp. 5P_3.1_Bac2 TaxID=2971617 RepID=UPI0021C6D274|nr:cellulose biosynthesis protein BcsQ [Pseudomonas sp. 5P_3.1_Bac2]MCU1717244.1 cellulose biosynthesis protein BcsQ [Pseudomonas sp. 5P_3.1_Bac2]